MLECGLPSQERERSVEQAAVVVLPVGQYPVKFGVAGALGLPARVRLALQPPERHAVP